MNYKAIFKTPAIRSLVLNLLSFLPDDLMLTLQYKIKLGRKPDLKHPKRFTEKLQWYKMHYRNPVMHQCVDKYKVREYVKSKGLESILVGLIGKYDSVEEVNWESIPEQFVIKTTNGGGGLNVVICKDKSKLNIEEITTKLSCKRKKENYGGREWAYYNSEPGIVIEQLLVNRRNPKAGVNDYKILCFNGHAKYVIVDADRYVGHKRNFYDREWNNLHVLSDCPAVDRELEKPENLSLMLDIAEKLSEDFPFVRVDLYNNEGQIYFGELTFYPWSGYVQFDPDEFDLELGREFNCM